MHLQTIGLRAYCWNYSETNTTKVGHKFKGLQQEQSKQKQNDGEWDRAREGRASQN